MKCYKVGGFCRDSVLGLEPKDVDWVVVGSTIEEMLSLGFQQVGNGFPVFLHPETREEYALARKEISVGSGYTDFELEFSPDTTLEEDLFRRDLTINAIAFDAETGLYVDPFGGIEDTRNKILRPVSTHFTDDPIRVLRLARLYARFGHNWTISDEAKKYMKEMFEAGALANLVPERIWAETQKALSEPFPELYFETLYGYGIFPEIDAMRGIPQPVKYHPEGDCWDHVMRTVEYASVFCHDAEVVFAALCHDLGKVVTHNAVGNLHGHEEAGVKVVHKLCDRLKVQNSFRKLAALVTEFHTHCHIAFEMNPNSVMRLFERTNAMSKQHQFEKFLMACEADKRGRGEPVCYEPYHQPKYLLECLKEAKKVNSKEISNKLLSHGKSGEMIGEAIRVARIKAIRGVDKSAFK